MNTASRIYGKISEGLTFCDTGVPELEKKRVLAQKKRNLSDHKITKFCEGYGK